MIISRRQEVLLYNFVVVGRTMQKERKNNVKKMLLAEDGVQKQNDTKDNEELICKVRMEILRKLVDPNFSDVKHLIGFIKAGDCNERFPSKANPRPSDGEDLNKRVYNDVVNSFLNVNCTPYTFHLKSHPVKITCSDVKKIGEDEFELIFRGKEGIADGLHCMNIIYKYKEQSPEQYIALWITTGIPDSFITEMSQGLNSSMQVELVSLYNYDGKFDWIKQAIQNESYRNQIDYIETTNRGCEVGLLIQILTSLDIKKYPIDKRNMPVCAYSNKSACIKEYDKRLEDYKAFKNILNDVLVIYDTIGFTAEKFSDKKDLQLGMYDKKGEGKSFEFYFINNKNTVKLRLGAVLPILSAFRYLIETNPENNNFYKWKKNLTIEELILIWEEVGSILIEVTKNNFIENGKNPNKLGKSTSHWRNISLEFQLWIKNKYEI